ncbi:Vi polysaccharide biosynthesis UDP-N-acetylglucosamine C-6 dehydrogenase TviB [Thalassomonas actiniarum]|uniref:Vi polysaccharide biosynthesis UDP-N-acetylglucosamine C-6 dehydrogenase TviB n=1 Tax=Thalassomonas actiniarum TaxID=485447 RepID=A0AAF0C3Z8_9GAMM|nr:Vi polysaccharide biosynthesis UDP-N-acetylglucosamine C-6 dehydrogenase TviB [Thalassomonas actiniarum]WDD99490.1 Vi polysaccharide biosynthesis UDP-N-acetylglucosamine C-6 dehydrogenase TviB [Thalassomonas actiniarum]
MKNIASLKIGIIGLGYVGLPLAVSFGKKYPTLGFDINQQRISELNQGVDNTLEVEQDELAQANQLTFSHDIESLSQCNFYIVTVPTPIDEYKQPDLTPLIKASETIAKVIQAGDIVVYESTVYPGATEEVCIPVIEKNTGMTFNRDFYAGYSPERINPGDKEHRLETILKVTAGSTPEIADFVDQVYASIITAGTHKASSIKVAEAAKVIENTQRDVNIALINELAVIFSKIGINTEEVLKAAGTKWNFLPFRPGLVGGHCIGVDPYYLTHKAQQLNYHPQVILSGRRINDDMGRFVVKRLVKAMIEKRIHIVDAKVLILGFTFKENCPDVRNTRVIDIVDELKDYSARVDIHDPWADADIVKHEYGIEMAQPQAGQYDAIIIAVGHQEFKTMSMPEIRKLGKPGALVFDLKYLFDAQESDLRL